MSVSSRIKHFALATVYIFVAFRTPLYAAQVPKATEYEVKAAYLYNFGKFVNWPSTGSAGGQDDFVICVLGQDPFGGGLQTSVVGERVGGKPVIAKHIANTEDGSHCRIIFISASEQSRVKQVLMDFAQSGALTVSDMPDFTARGGMIQFVMRDNKVRFEVNLTAAERARLNLSSELLKVAVSVRRDQEREN
ncbi:MAG TPA: YfiR family protein [Candidatus Acidoferrales bacterium]|nr:YfiR family protein [Candidatus Acidoferrales bacterium]